MKSLTPDQRIASVDDQTRERMIQDNLAGRGMKHLATDYGISEGTVRAIIHDSKLTDRPRLVLPVPTDLWNRPDLWRQHGLKGPESYRMV